MAKFNKTLKFEDNLKKKIKKIYNQEQFKNKHKDMLSTN